MKDICNWEYDGEHGYGECAIVHDNKWDEIPEAFQELLPSESKSK